MKLLEQPSFWIIGFTLVAACFLAGAENEFVKADITTKAERLGTLCKEQSMLAPCMIIRKDKN